MLADGSESVFDIYEGIVAWDGRPRRIAVDATERVPLVGMAMRDGHELTIEIRSLGRVLIRELP
jgi:predicted aspartyl protease